MRAPSQLPYGVFVALHERQRSAVGIADIERAQQAIDAASSDHGVVVLVPVVREDLRGWAASWSSSAALRRAGVDGDCRNEMVLG